MRVSFRHNPCLQTGDLLPESAVVARIVKLLASILVVILIGVSLTTASFAQTSSGAGPQPLCALGCQSGHDTTPPTISLLQPSGPVGTATPAIELGYCDNTALNRASRVVQLNGTDVTSSFSYGLNDGCVAYDTSAATTDTVNLGKNTLFTSICDTAGNCSSATYFIYRTNAPFLVSLHNSNGDNIDRGLCLTVGAGQAAGLSCGDLFVVHAMPAYRTLSRDRRLSLLYNSATASPHPTVAVWVTQVSGSAPANVYAELDVQRAGIWTARAQAEYNGWSWKIYGGIRQLALSYDAIASGDTATGVYPFRVLVTDQNPGSVTDTVTGSFLLVNRSASEFGAGWGIVGVERLVLHQAAGSVVWVDGSGSAAVYDSVLSGTWVRRTGPFRDTLTYGQLWKFGPNGYRRWLRHGVIVTFDSTGHQVQTTDPAGDTTNFVWSSSTPARLLSIRVPPNVGATTYSLTYNAANYLHSIADPAGRVLRDSVSGGNLIQFVDPDGYGVTVGYDGARRLTSRTGRRGFTTRYLYSRGLHVDSIRVPLAPSASTPNDTARSSVSWWDEQGLAMGIRTDTTTPGDTVHAYTRVDGPRTNVQDIATFWVDRWGAPVLTVGAVNDTTRLARDSVTALVSFLQDPDSNVWYMSYDRRGNLLTATNTTHQGQWWNGNFASATTRYTYDDSLNTRDDPDSIIDPTGVVTRFAYSSQLDTLVIAPNGQRTRYTYGSDSLQSLVVAVTNRQVRTVNGDSTNASLVDQTTTLAYDALGNLASATTPLGYTTHYYRNQYTQDSSVVDPLGNVTRLRSGIMGDLDSLIRVGSPSNRTEIFRYDHDFDRDSVIDPRGVVRSYAFDAAGRDTSETDDYALRERFYLGPSGLLDSSWTRDSMMVRHAYDAAGRQTALWFPPRSDGKALGDSAVFTYDRAGHLLTASNRSGKISRTYNREGTLKQSEDTTYANGQSSHVFMQYLYLLNNARSWFSDSATSQSDAIWRTYTYDGAGQLSSIVVEYPFNSSQDTASYTWDGLGRLQQEITPHHQMRATINWYYDADGRLRRINTAAQENCHGCLDSAWVDAHYRTYDGVGRLLSTFTYLNGINASQDSGLFDAFGEESLAVVNGIPNSLKYDASGNLVSRIQTVSGAQYGMTFHIDSGAAGAHNRMLTDSLVAQGVPHWNDSFKYTGSGARALDSVPSGNNGGRAMHYDALGHMTQLTTFTPQYQCTGWTQDIAASVAYSNNVTCIAPLVQDSVGDGFRYDALGRLIQTPSGLPMVYDGNQVVRVRGTRISYGPGPNNPITVYDTVSSGIHPKYYFVTDGSGGLLSFTDSAGHDMTTGTPWQTFAARAIHSGVILNAHNFAATSRLTPDAPSLSFFQNRWYDQRTGRWTQEDPVGPAGGVNLYAYAGNNPLTYTDPFGLCVPPSSLECQFINAVADRTRGLEKLEPAMLLVASLPTIPATEGAITTLGIAGAARDAYVAGRALSATVEAAGRTPFLQQGARVLSFSRHLLTGSAQSAGAHAFAEAGVDVLSAARTVASDIGDLSKLAPGLQRGSVQVGEHVIDYSAYTQETGETSVNFWLRRP